MRRTIIVTVAVVAVCLASTVAVRAMYSVANRGTWPKSWPAELEPLRAQARTLVGPVADQTFYEIPFTKREQFEAAWPHILKVKDKGTPLILVRGPNAALGARIAAGVRVHCPPTGAGKNGAPNGPIESTDVRMRWMWTTYVEVIVDGDVVDLNRVALPGETVIVDERFKEGK